MDEKLFLQACAGKISAVPPLWMMRQAGRYLPEYRQIRATAPSFLDFCYSPKLAAEATLQPIRRFGFDAAILFSDILVVPDALGQKVSFETGEGPRLEPIRSAEDLDRLSAELDFDRLAPVFETIDRVKSVLPKETSFIGFCGAPWTVASYMIAGKGTPDQAPARLFAYQYPKVFQALIDRLIEASVAYLSRQILAGVEAVQIFDSWSGILPRAEFMRWCYAPVKAIIDQIKIRHPQVCIITFPRGATNYLRLMAEQSGADVIGLDTAVNAAWAAEQIQSLKPVQGNLDPLVLLAGGDALVHHVEEIKHAFAAGPYIFNLGHGILPPTPVAHVEQLVKLVRNQ